MRIELVRREACIVNLESKLRRLSPRTAAPSSRWAGGRPPRAPPHAPHPAEHSRPDHPARRAREPLGVIAIVMNRPDRSLFFLAYFVLEFSQLAML